jgi:repressor LexA
MSVKMKGQPIVELNGVFNSEIAETMARRNLTTLEQFADFAQIGRTTVYNLVLGRTSASGTVTKPSIDTLIALSSAFNMPLHELLYKLAPDAIGADTIKNVPPVQSLEVSIAGWCGAGPEQTESLDEKVWIESSLAKGRELTAFRVKGDSMAATDQPIHNGDVVIVDTGDKGKAHQPVVAKLKSGGYVCKLLKRDRHEEALVSANPVQTNGTPHYIFMNHIEEIVGRVILVMHEYSD